MKNLHLEHPEDTILTGDLSVLDWFTASNSHLSVKIDGAPAIVWGRNPASGKFFVGTKSVFNKVKIKINESHQDIDKNHTGEVAAILHNCFDNLPRINGIIQGDFIGVGGSDIYRPNTITYQFDEVVTHNIIVAPHTAYIAQKDLRDAIAFPITKQQKSTDKVLFFQPNVTLAKALDDIEDYCKFARQMSTMVEFVSDKEAAKIKKQINSCIRELSDINEEDFDCDANLIRLWKLVESIKLDMFAFINIEDDTNCFIEDEKCEHEGLVMYNDYGAYKIIHRDIFSYYNFTLAKRW